MPASGDELSRPAKLDDPQTVLYEIDMLRWARARLLSHLPTEADQWVYLENFLLHYRNLIEFFGKPVNDPTDLSVHRPEIIWRGLALPAQADLDFMTRNDLWEKYDTRDNPAAISKYLHHCTAYRTVGKRWRVQEMYEELRPVIEKFESLLPNFKPATELAAKSRPPAASTVEGQSTTTVTRFQSLIHNE